MGSSNICSNPAATLWKKQSPLPPASRLLNVQNSPVSPPMCPTNWCKPRGTEYVCKVGVYAKFRSEPCRACLDRFSPLRPEESRDTSTDSTERALVSCLVKASIPVCWCWCAGPRSDKSCSCCESARDDGEGPSFLAEAVPVTREERACISAAPGHGGGSGNSTAEAAAAPGPVLGVHIRHTSFIGGDDTPGVDNADSVATDISPHVSSTSA